MPCDSTKTIEDLPPLREVISAHNLRAEKSLGQNFLLDQNLTDKIVRQCGDLSGKTVIEIGPGPGGLTRSLLKSNAKKVMALEYDPRAVEALQGLKDAAQGRLEVLQRDALETDLLSLSDGPRVIVANLPYNIATPLLIGWLQNIREHVGCYDEMVLMFQKEVAKRILAQPRTQDYGLLTVVSQNFWEVKAVLEAGAIDFFPKPNVASRVVCFDRKEVEPLFCRPDYLNFLKNCFQQKRKKMINKLSVYGKERVAKAYEDLGWSPDLRVDTLSPNDFKGLYRLLQE